MNKVVVDKRTVEAVRNTRLIQTILSLPYGVLVNTEEDGTIFAEVVELPGCMTEVDDENDLDEMVSDAIVCWVVDCIADGESVPLPAGY